MSIYISMEATKTRFSSPTALLPFAASAILLTMISAPTNLAIFAWVSLVPFILAVSSSMPARSLLIWSYVAGIFYWLVNTYFLMHVTFAGWLAMAPYLALYWPALVFSLRLCNYRKVPLWLSAGVLFTGAEALQGWVFTGFSWRFLAHSQYANIRLIQIADIFGAAGVSFLIALVNGLAATIIIDCYKRKVFTLANLWRLTAILAVIAVALAYGNHRINESGGRILPGPTIAAIQTNVPQSVKESGKAGQAIFDDLLKDSESALAARPALIVWPETMVTGFLNPKILACLSQESESRQFHKALQNFAARGTYLLVGAPAATPVIRDGQIALGDKFNSAFLYQPDGTQFSEHYSKMHLVPFGEYVPFRRTIPPLYNLLMRLTPYDYEYTLTSGTSLTRFKLQAMDRSFRFGVLICYEDTTPEVARSLVYGGGGKNLDWLVNISNDGWFVQETPKGIIPSVELAQHTAICVFRAVENRVSIVRSVNTGISTIIDSMGRIGNDPMAGSLPHNTFDRQGVSGWFAAPIMIDSRSTFFGAHGRWLDFYCAIAFAASIIVPVLGILLLRKRQRTAP
jgi:apolipoprotein N-acyltransferase